jgi:Na+-translocating ferredoxin:NAD+ oxidoreductase RnfC subunit
MATPEFENLSARGSLLIPLGTRATELESVELKLNQPIESRASFLSGSLANSHLPLVPCKALTGNLAEAQLTAGQSVQTMQVSIEQFTATMQPLETTDRIAGALAHARREMLPRETVRLQDAGIHADRVSSPNLIAQLTQAVKRPIDTVICPLLDSDPAAPLQLLLAKTYPIELAAGISFIRRIAGAARAAVALAPGRWPASLRARLKDQNISEISLAGDYPQSDPSLLLYAVLGRKLRPSRLPTELGVIVLDAAAAIAVGRFLLLDEPMTQVPIALHDWRARKTRYAIAPVGISISDALKQLKINHDSTVIRGGDSLRDLRIGSDAVIAGSELVIHISDCEPAHNPDPCIRCGWCVEVCPTRVQPAGVLEAAQRKDRDLAERMGVSACIECGLCSFVCPSKLPLLAAIRTIKSER